MSTGTFLWNYSDIYTLDKIVRHTGIVHGRTLIIDHLKDCFARDREYRYLTDKFGYTKAPKHKDLVPDAGIVDDSTTRIEICAFHKYAASYLPVVSVRQTSSAYKPISFNQNKYTVDYEIQRIEDGYGNVDFVKVPSKYIFAGAWDQSYEIKITSDSQEDTAAIADLVMISLQATYRDSLERNGLFIKDISSSGENTESVNGNDPVYTCSITANAYAEWRREIPISSLLDRINICFTFDVSDKDIPANALSIKTTIEV